MVAQYGGGGISGSRFNVLQAEEAACAGLHGFGLGLALHNGVCPPYFVTASSEEERAWTCITVIPHRLTGCTTHLSTNVRVAWNQCRELSTILASSWVQPEVIVSGDFNLKSAPGRRYDVGTCAPSGYERRDDGTLQQVFYSPDVEWVTGDRQRMHWTDHPLLYERFRV